MMKHKYMAVLLCAAVTLAAAGCGKGDGAVEITPTPAPTATPTPVPATPTPMPTTTPAPRRIGVKTADSKYITLTNSTGKVLRSIYLRTSGNEDWGSDLIPVEASVKASEQVQMYYTPAQEEDAVYDMQIVISDDEVYEIYSVDLSDMEKASLDFQDDTAFLRYMSLSSKKEMNTRDNEPVSDDSYDDYGNESYGGSDDQNDYDNGYDNGYDDSYDPDYDNGYDDGDDNSTDVGTDDGNGDGGDGQGTDDGNDDDGGDDTGDGDDGGGDIVWDENGNWTEG